jgi:hypothetical protein
MRAVVTLTPDIEDIDMNLLYLPTLIALAMKYGPELAAGEKMLQDYTPLAVNLLKAIAPVIQQQVGGLKLTDPAQLVAGVQQVLEDINHPTLTQDEQNALANRLSQMS